MGLVAHLIVIPKKLIMSLDPVACDYRGWQVINIERQNLGQGIIPWPVYHIQTASQSPYNLGTTDINLIEIINPQGIEERNIGLTDKLLKILPNPFRKSTTLNLTLPNDSPVYIDLIDISGRTTENIFSGYLTKGAHHITYNKKGNIASGNYFFRIYYQGSTYLKKVTVLN